MAPVGVRVDQLVQELFDVVQQSVLPLIDEDGRGGMQRLQVHHAVADPALAHDVVDAIGHVDQLHAIVGDPIYDAVKNLKTRHRLRLAGFIASLGQRRLG